MPRITETTIQESALELLKIQEAIDKARFKVVRIRDKYERQKESDTMDPMWSLYRKGLFGIWWFVNDFKYFDSCEEKIREINQKEEKKFRLKNEEPFYFAESGRRINRADENPK